VKLKKETIKAGLNVFAKERPEWGTGKIVELDEVLNKLQATVYFPETGLQTLWADELEVIKTPFDLLKSGQFQDNSTFNLRLLATQLSLANSSNDLLSLSNSRTLLLPHQVIATNKVLDSLHHRFLLADEVGLGKTIEAAMIYTELKYRKLARRVIILTPATLTRQWQDEMRLRFKEEFVIYNGSVIESLRDMHGKNVNVWKLNNKIITSIDFAKPKIIRDEDPEKMRESKEEHNRVVTQALVEGNWDLVIVDEAHKLSKDEEGHETTRYKLGAMLASAIPNVLFLTATPHQGKQVPFYHLVSLLDSYAFPKPQDVHPDSLKPIMVRNKKRAVCYPNGDLVFKGRNVVSLLVHLDPEDENDMKELDLYEQVTDYVTKEYDRARGQGNKAVGFVMVTFQKLVSSSSAAIRAALEKRLARLRNLYNQLKAAEELLAKLTTSGIPTDVEDLSELYGEEIEKIALALSATTATDVDELEQEIRIVEGLYRLADEVYKLQNDSKTRRLVEAMAEVFRKYGDPNKKILIFTEFVTTQKYLKGVLEKKGFDVVILNGDMSLDQKMNAKEEFRTRAQVMVSTEAGGEGINLQFCKVMFNYDLPWNPMRLEQRIGRLDRFGQKETVFVQNLQLEHSIEYRIRTRLEEKLDIIKAQFGEDKLTDVLNFLQEEFNFDEIYMKAISRISSDETELRKIAENIVKRAKEIIESDDRLMPFTEFGLEMFDGIQTRSRAFTNQDLERLVGNFLAQHGKEIKSYTEDPKIVWFSTPDILRKKGLQSEYRYVTFDREKALEDERLDLVAFGHEVVDAIVDTCTSYDYGGLCVRKIVKAPRFVGTKGLHFNFIVRYITDTKERLDEIEGIFVDMDGNSRPELAEIIMQGAWQGMEEVNSDPLPTSIDVEVVDHLYEIAEETLEKKMAKKSKDIEARNNQLIDREIDKIKSFTGYHLRRLNAQTGLPAVLEAEKKKLLKKQETAIRELEQKRKVIPKRELLSVTYVEVT